MALSSSMAAGPSPPSWPPASSHPHSQRLGLCSRDHLPPSSPQHPTWTRSTHAAASSQLACSPPRTSCARATARTPTPSRSSRATGLHGWRSSPALDVHDGDGGRGHLTLHARSVEQCMHVVRGDGEGASATRKKISMSGERELPFVKEMKCSHLPKNGKPGNQQLSDADHSDHRAVR